MKPFIENLELVIQDLKDNYKNYDRSKLVKIFGQFQNQFLTLKKTNIEISTKLNELSLKQILACQNKLGLELISPPKQKVKLIPLVSALAIQKKKKNELLESVKMVKTLTKKPTSKTTKTTTVQSDSNYEDLRKSWLTNINLTKLEIDLLKIKMNEIRAIVKPWSLKPADRTKKGLINAVIEYIKRMKKLSKLGI